MGKMLDWLAEYKAGVAKHGEEVYRKEVMPRTIEGHHDGDPTECT